jgi:arylsulfatase A-like enzyme
LLIIASDHGEEFGEHRVMAHGSSLYLPSLHVPLTISFPARVPAGQIVQAPVSLRDLPATVLELLGLRDGPQIPGRSLARFWDSAVTSNNGLADIVISDVSFAAGLPPWFPISKGGMRSVVLEQYHYIKNGDGREELYDFENDPFEQADLSGSVEGRRQIAKFRSALTEALQE